MQHVKGTQGVFGTKMTKVTDVDIFMLKLFNFHLVCFHCPDHLEHTALAMPCVWQTTARPATSEEPPSPDPHQDPELRDWCEDDQPWKNIENLPEGWIEQKEWFEDDHHWKDSDNILKAVLKHIVLYCGIQDESRDWSLGLHSQKTQVQSC